MIKFGSVTLVFRGCLDKWGRYMLRILLSGGGTVWRLGVKALLEKSGDATVVLARDDEKISGNFDVVVLETSSSRDGWVQAVVTARRRYPGAGVVAVLERPSKEEFLAALEAGVRGFIRLGADDGELVEAVKCVARGNAFVSRTFLEDAGLLSVDASAPAGAGVKLTEREREILELLTRGLANKEIAQALFITEKTVKNHLYRVFKKLGVHGRTQAALVAMSLGTQKNKSLD